MAIFKRKGIILQYIVIFMIAIILISDLANLNTVSTINCSFHFKSIIKKDDIKC